MSDKPTKKSKSSSNQPTHHVFAVRDTGGDKPFWDKVGAAWEHKDKKGFTQKLDILGLDVELVVRANQPKPSRNGKKIKNISGPRP